jgi:hypothetical protein
MIAARQKAAGGEAAPVAPAAAPAAEAPAPPAAEAPAPPPAEALARPAFAPRLPPRPREPRPDPRSSAGREDGEARLARVRRAGAAN